MSLHEHDIEAISNIFSKHIQNRHDHISWIWIFFEKKEKKNIAAEVLICFNRQAKKQATEESRNQLPD